MTLAILFLVALWAGIQNALAGGGAFLTLPALMLSGLDARLANITSTVALFPAQVTMGWVGRRQASGVGALNFKTMFALSLIGGAIGALLLRLTPPTYFAHMVPWLTLVATSLFAHGSFFRKPGPSTLSLPTPWVVLIQLAIAIYGGYFGGGIGFLMLATFTAAGMAVRAAGATKNALAAAMNASAVLVFAMTPNLPWGRAAIMAAGSIIGGWIGAKLLQHVDERLVRGFVVVLGVALTIAMFSASLSGKGPLAGHH